jgi:H+/Na+-translocating ferredoxin:NAD+ oxidoreductase subunit C
LKTFAGGIHPPGHKSLAKDCAISDFPMPDRVVLPMSQHIGAPCKPIVKKGDRVLTGQMVGEPQGFVSAPIFSSITGNVVAVEPCASAVTGAKGMAVIIERDGDEEWAEGKNIEQDTASLDADAIKARISEAGIVGMGGATFPTHVKLSPPPNFTIDTVILNAAECEPYLTCDHRLMLEEPKKVLDGFILLCKALGCDNGIIALEANKPDSFKAMQDAAQGTNIQVLMVETKYPQGAEHQLIKALTGREVPWKGGLPMAVGCVVQNVATAYAVYEACALNKPLIERVTTITGDGVGKPCNVRVRLGTMVGDLLTAAEIKKDAKKLISGGPMMGIAQRSADTPVTKGTSGILVLRDGSKHEAGPCIRCGRCVDACPYGLTPAALSRAIEQINLDAAMEWNVLECKECGCCTYVCPGRRPIVHQVKFAKMELLKIKHAKEAH